MAEVEKINVTMTDGREVAFSTKQKLVKESSITDDAIVVRLDFRNGQTRNFEIPEALLDRFAAHGAEQKLGDAIAGETDLEDAIASVDALIAQLSAGEWNIKRAKGEFSGVSVLLRALVEASGKPVESLRAWLAAKTQAEKMALRQSATLKPIIERLEAEKTSKSKNAVDTDSLLGEISDIG